MGLSRRNRSTSIAAVLLVLLAGSGSAGAQEDPFTIHLKSRSFAPAPGVEAPLKQITATRQAGWVGLLQFNELPDEAERAALERAGVHLLEYIPNNTWIARLPADVNQVQSLAGVRWIGRLLPGDKLHPRLAERLGPKVTPLPAKLEIEVEAVEGSFDAARARIEALGGRVIEAEPTLGYLRVELPRSGIQSLAASDAVLWIAPAPPAKVPHNDQARINTRANLVQAPLYSLSGSGIDLGIWDGGSVFGHLDFTGRLTIVDVVAVSGHSTHVAGTMAGDGVNSPVVGQPVGFFRGMAPAAQIISYDFNGSTTGEHNGAINTWGIDNSQNSWGYGITNANCALFGDYDIDSRNYDRIITGLYGRRIPVVFSAGNSRNDGICGMTTVPPFINYANVPGPGQTAKNVITVGAINGDNSAMTDFSSWGPVDDGRVKPELVAPGCNAGGYGATASTSDTGGYSLSCGTSMAAPAVSGNIGLLLERYRQICPSTPDPLPSTVRAVLVHAARDLDNASTFLNRGPDYASGYGALDIKDAVDVLPFHVEDSVGNTNVDTYTITVTQQSDLKVTLAWDDVAAAAGAGVTLVNNLDLELVDPNSVVHRPWILNPASPAAAATRAADNRNVIEMVVVDNVTALNAGTWTIRVIGTSVPNGPQSYSLVSQHLTASSCAGAPSADAWIKDKETPLTPVDPGTEPNPDTGAMWVSNEIWVRNNPDNGLVHQNPDFGQVNYIHARIRNNGTVPVNTVRAMVYYANASAGLSWPVDWHLIGEATVVNLSATGTPIITVPWSPPGTGHYCLYVRLISDQDPMTFAEGASVYTNTRNNNNIAWKNVNVVNVLSEGEIVELFVRNTRRTAEEITITLGMPADDRGATLNDFATIDLIVSDELRIHLEEQGIELGGEGFERVDDRTLRVAGPTAELPPIWMDGRAEFKLQVSFQRRRAAPTPTAKVYVLDVNQNFPTVGVPGQVETKAAVDPEDPNVGGVRYEVQVQ